MPPVKFPLWLSSDGLRVEFLVNSVIIGAEIVYIVFFFQPQRQRKIRRKLTATRHFKVNNFSIFEIDELFSYPINSKPNVDFAEFFLQ